ncbi:hypothetical protein PF003_g15576 [Phytophthora fragariae]|nr:hypothetical protein PF003_g15576 [Phytophthora fragariae]
MKLCKFRGLVLSDGLSAAGRVQAEFCLQDGLLSELLYDQQKAQLAALTQHLPRKSTASGTSQPVERSVRPPKQPGTPATVLRKLPTEGTQSLCMKYLSKGGCSGGGAPGKCFSNKRVHFRPTHLPGEARDYITTRFGGLAPEFADL